MSIKIQSISIANFKAIEHADIDLGDFNVLVGANGSGKSSVLQALHWMFQSGRNSHVEANKQPTKGSTLSEKDAIYMPSLEYRDAGQGDGYGNRQDAPQLNLSVCALDANGDEQKASMWIKSARNEGISVHLPSGNPIVAAIRDQKREFSAYIPGVAGIALAEEKRSKQIVHRSAAAGDANTMLRNILNLLSAETIDGKNALDVVQDYVSRVMGEFSLRVRFNDDTDSRIQASFQTEQIRAQDVKRFKPLELAGIGFLQVLQIFAYLVYFRPVMLLVDEPDAHLYPVAQEKLVVVLSEAARTFGAQVLLTTHSPSIVRSLPTDSRVIWMKDGGVRADGDTAGRQLMGWGLLDRKIVLMTEDSQRNMIRSIVSQWPDLERITAIWPFHGTGKLPPPETLDGLRALLGDDVRFVIHRDADFMMPDEVKRMAKPYADHGHRLWVTKYSDMEAYWTSADVVEAHLGVSRDDANLLIAEAVAHANEQDDAAMKRRKKRVDILAKLKNDGLLPQFGDKEVFDSYTVDGHQFGVLGKAMLGRIRERANTRHYPKGSSLGKTVPTGLSKPLASDLEKVLRSVAK